MDGDIDAGPGIPPGDDLDADATQRERSNERLDVGTPGVAGEEESQFVLHLA